MWSTYVVDGDLGHEIDAREMPEGWAYPYFPRRASTPYATPPPAVRGGDLPCSTTGCGTGPEQTKDLTLPDLPGMAQARAVYAGARGTATALCAQGCAPGRYDLLARGAHERLGQSLGGLLERRAGELCDLGHGRQRYGASAHLPG